MAMTRKQQRERREALIILRAMANRVIWWSSGVGYVSLAMAREHAVQAHKFAQLAWREYLAAGRGMVS